MTVKRTHFNLNPIALCLMLFSSPMMIAQVSPPVLNSDINWTDTGGEFDPSTSTFDATFNGVTDIEAAFNNGRRNEETQLGVTANALGDLVLPSDWNSRTVNEKALFLLNAERAARNVLYSTAGITPDGDTFEGIEYQTAQLSQQHGEYLVKEGIFDHTGVCGLSSFGRIDEHPFLGNDVSGSLDCHEFLRYGENLAIFFSSSDVIPLKLERAIYAWLYDDAIASWGHRLSCLYQGFNDNHGSSGSEGYIGVAVVGDVVVMNYFDPPSTGCDGAYFLTPSPTLPTAVASANMTYHADWEFTMPDGWTYYFDDNGTRLNLLDDILLLAIERNGDHIGRVAASSCTFDVEVGNGSGCIDLSSANYVTNSDGWYVMNRYFDVTPESAPAGNMAVRMYYATANYTDLSGCATGLSSHEDMTFYKVAAGLDPDPNSGSHNSMSTPADIVFLAHDITPALDTWKYASFGSNHSAEFMVSSFSGGGGGGSTGPNSNPLPVEFLSFNGELIDNSEVYLSWSTAQEINNDYFIVERFNDEGTYAALDYVEGQGWSGDISHYDFVDYAPLAGWNYYRISQVDFDGATSFSNVVGVYVDMVTGVTIYPVPARDWLHVDLETGGEATFGVRIYDAGGRLHLSMENLDSGQAIDVSDLAAGMHILEIQSAGVRDVRKFLKS